MKTTKYFDLEDWGVGGGADYANQQKESEELTYLLTTWLTFADNVRPSDAAGEDWLQELRHRTAKQLKMYEDWKIGSK
jgi:hypothetical protein